jgi:hypothetical protein
VVSLVSLSTWRLVAKTAWMVDGHRRSCRRVCVATVRSPDSMEGRSQYPLRIDVAFPGDGLKHPSPHKEA